MKEETLEDAAEKHTYGNAYQNFIRGAQWQSERMYSDEEVKVIVNKVRETGLTVEYLLLTEQFKKK